MPDVFTQAKRSEVSGFAGRAIVPLNSSCSSCFASMASQDGSDTCRCQAGRILFSPRNFLRFLRTERLSVCRVWECQAATHQSRAHHSRQRHRVLCTALSEHWKTPHSGALHDAEQDIWLRRSILSQPQPRGEVVQLDFCAVRAVLDDAQAGEIDLEAVHFRKRLVEQQG